MNIPDPSAIKMLDRNEMLCVPKITTTNMIAPTIIPVVIVYAGTDRIVI
jgi:hypothetical protein